MANKVKTTHTHTHTHTHRKLMHQEYIFCKVSEQRSRFLAAIAFLGLQALNHPKLMSGNQETLTF